MNIGQRIAKCRKNTNISQEQLAEMLEVSRQTISKWETGLATPDTYNIVQLSRIFRVSVEYLTCGSEEIAEPPKCEYIPDQRLEREDEDEDEDDEREARDKRKFWGFVLLVWGITSFVRFFNPGIEFAADIWWLRVLVGLILSIPCLFGIKLLIEKK